MKRMILVAAIGALLVALTAGGAFAANGLAQIDCSGDNTSRCDGTADDDNITGAGDGDDNPDDIIRGFQGQDDIEANGGDDEVRGGPSDDDIDGGPGDDILRGGKGDDNNITDNDGPDDNDDGDDDPADDDVVIGGAGEDTLEADDGDGEDVINGGPGRDDCFGDAGDEFISCEVINGEEQ